MRERLLLLKEQLEPMEKNVFLKEENTRLKEQKKEHTIQIEQYSLPEKFNECNGVFLEV